MRLVSAAKHAALRTGYDLMVKQRDDAARLAEERQATIARQAEEIARLRDSRPDAPVSQPRPQSGDVELRRQLQLARRAIAVLEQQREESQRANESLTAELLDLRTGVSS